MAATAARGVLWSGYSELLEIALRFEDTSTVFLGAILVTKDQRIAFRRGTLFGHRFEVSFELHIIRSLQNRKRLVSHMQLPRAAYAEVACTVAFVQGKALANRRRAVVV